MREKQTARKILILVNTAKGGKQHDSPFASLELELENEAQRYLELVVVQCSFSRIAMVVVNLVVGLD